MGKPRLCIVSPAHWKPSMGGAEYQIACLLDTLIALDRHEIYYLAHRVAVDFQPAEYRIIKIGKGGAAPRWGYIAHALPLYRALRSIRPDVIYQRVACGYTGIAAYYAHRQGACLIWHVAHDTDLMPSATLGGRNPVRHFLERRSIEYGLRHATHVVVQTERQAKLLQANYRRTADAVIPNFHPQSREVIDKSGPLLVVWIANFKPWKQPEAFLELAAALSDLKDVRFVMVGSSSGATAELMRSIRAAGNVEYRGERSQSDVNELLARAHIFVNTSLYEGFPNTFIQAWMREVPVASLHVDPDGVLEREEIGLCAGSVERLAEFVRLLISNPELRAEYALRAREHAMRRHSLRNADVLADMIENCVSGNASR